MFAKCFMMGVGMVALASFAQAETRIVKSVVHTDARTGKLVRTTTISSPAVSAPAQPDSLKNLIDAIAEKNEVEAPLVRSVIQAESNYNPAAVSNKGAQGLMQLIPSTARRFGVKDSFDARENVEGGVKYLKYLINLFHGDYAQAVAAYNAGEAAVTRYGGIPPYKETRNYVAEVARHLEVQRRSYTAPVSPVDPAPVAAADSAETYNPVIASFSPDGRVSYRTP